MVHSGSVTTAPRLYIAFTDRRGESVRRSCVIYAAKATGSSAINVLPCDLRVHDKLDLQSSQTDPLSKPRIPLVSICAYCTTDRTY